MTFYANTFFQIISFFYIVLVGVVFFFKKKVETVENTIFFRLIIVGIISCVLDVLSIVIAHIFPDAVSTLTVCRLYLVALISYSLLFTEYTYITTNNNYSNEDKLIKYKKFRKLAWVIGGIFGLVIFLLPILVFVKDDIMYTYGPAVTVSYVVCGVCIILWISLLLVRLKHLTFRRIAPIVTSIVFGLLATIIQLFYQEILLVTAAEVYSIIIMYFTVFTIENPDLEMIEEIKTARNEAIKASQAKSDFLSNMSHELRTPLNAILGFSQSLLEQDLSSQMKDDIEDIVSASDTLLELVNEILDISKIESQKLEIVNVEYVTKKIYKYLVTMTEGRIGSRQLEFIREFDDDIPPVLFGDCVRIKQVVVNLLTNAVKYTKDGYVKLHMMCEKIDDEYVNLIIAVSDSGIGIKEEDLNKMFVKFERFDIKKNMNIEGTGLGLALTKQLLDLMGGEIKVESKYGVGSTFTVTIKQKIVNKNPEELEGEQPLLTRGTFKGHNEVILVVDDNNVNLKVATRLLKPYNVQVELSTSGKDCLSRIVAGKHYDLILLDDQMPEMTGVETIQHLREIPGFKIPTIALTANAISGVKEKYIADGFDGYLAKPMDKILLEELLVEFLGGDDKKTANVTPPTTPITTPATTPVATTSAPVPATIPKEEDIEELDDFDDIPPKVEAEEILDDDIDSPVVIGTVPVTEALVNEVLNAKFLRDNEVDLDSALTSLGDMEIYNDTCGDVLAEIDSKINNLKRYCAENDMTNYAVVAHALKSDAKYLGLMTLADKAYTHELAAKDKKYKFIRENLDDLLKKTSDDMKIIKRYLGK